MERQIEQLEREAQQARSRLGQSLDELLARGNLDNSSIRSPTMPVKDPLLTSSVIYGDTRAIRSPYC